jgi:phosphoglycerate kinase
VTTLPRLEGGDVSGLRVIVRCDLNVPLEDGHVADDLRVKASVPTLVELLEAGAKLTVCSHLGRPKGEFVDALRMAPVAERLGELLGRGVVVPSDVVGPNAKEAAASGAEVVLLENLRFEPGEEANDSQFSDDLSSLGDAYVNDAFGSSHRKHASIVGLPRRLPSAAGRLLEDEVEKLGRLLSDPQPPFAAVMGGAKVSDKLGVLAKLLERVQILVVGGAMAFTLLAARGEDVGRSRIERDRLDEVRKVLEDARAAGVEILLPSDVVAAAAPEEALAAIGDRVGVDIGPQTRRAFGAAIRSARTVLWNGPMGIFEVRDFAHGTEAVAEALFEATQNGAYTVVGGGDSAAALRSFGMSNAASHVSTGGGASLEFLEGRELPGIAALEEATPLPGKERA